MKNPASPLSAVILDVDGTLIASNDAHAQAFLDAAAELGLKVPPFDEVRRRIGMGGDKLIPEVWDLTAEEGVGSELSNRKGELFRGRYLRRLQATPGARALLERFRDDGLRLVVATSAQEKDLSGLLEQAQVAELIAESTSASEVEESKPDPDVVLSALEKSGAVASEVIMLGDTPYDMESAGRAGVRIVGVRCGGWRDEDLDGAIAVYEDPADILRHYSESPFGNRQE